MYKEDIIGNNSVIHIENDLARGKIFNYGRAGKGVRNMTLENLRGKTPEELLDMAGITTVPVDLNKLFEHLSVSVLPTNFEYTETTEGMDQVIKERGKVLAAVSKKEKNGNNNDRDVTILYREGEDAKRTRFSIVHELGHCVVDTDTVLYSNVVFTCEQDIESYINGDSSEESDCDFINELRRADISDDKLSNVCLKSKEDIIKRLKWYFEKNASDFASKVLVPDKFLGKFHDKYSYSDISDICGIPEAIVEKRVDAWKQERKLSV